MAYYVQPDYWLDGYAEGDAKLTGAKIVAQSVLLAASSRSEVEIGIKADSQSAMLLGTYRVRLSGLSANGESDIDAGSALAISRALLPAATGQAYGAISITAKGAAKTIALSSGKSAMKLKWESEPEPGDAWTDRAEPSDIWSDIAEPGDAWSDT